jgi:hypothetical protein
MKKMEIAEAQRLLTDYVNNPIQDPVILTHHGKPLAVVLAADGADEETLDIDKLSDKLKKYVRGTPSARRCCWTRKG